MAELFCDLCGAPETERPLFGARFDGHDLRFCPGCMPTLIHGLTSLELQGVLRQKSAAAED
jgi:hypothetical protein